MLCSFLYFQNLDILARLSRKRTQPQQPSPQKKAKPSSSAITYDTVSVFVNQKWLKAKAIIKGRAVAFWNDRYNQDKPPTIKVPDKHGHTITKELVDDEYQTEEEESSPDDLEEDERYDDEEYEDEEDDDLEETVLYKSPLQNIDSENVPPKGSYKLPPPTEMDEKFQKQKDRMRKDVDSSDNEEEEQDSEMDYDKEEYAQAIRILTKYSTVAHLKTKQSSSQMGHAGIQKRDKEFIMLNASTFDKYITNLSTKLEDSKPTKKLNLYMCNKKQYEFPDPKPWQLEAAVDQPEVELILDTTNLPANKKIFTFYGKDDMLRMESQMWAATDACSHLDHFLHGASEANKQAILELRKLDVPLEQQPTLDAALSKLTDANRLLKVAGINNIQVAQSCITAGANHQLLRRDSILMYHHENLDISDIRQLRSQPFGQKKLFGPIIESKAKIVTDHTSDKAYRLIIENSSKQAEDAKKKHKGGQGYQGYQAPQHQPQQSYNSYPQARGGYRGRAQPRGRGFINAYNKDTSRFQSRGQAFRPRRNNNRGGFRPRGGRGRAPQQQQYQSYQQYQ